MSRPDGAWSLLIINKDQENAHEVHIVFDDVNAARRAFTGPLTVKTFGKAQYQWHPTVAGGTADPDGPILSNTIHATPSTTFSLPAASITVLRGNIK